MIHDGVGLAIGRIQAREGGNWSVMASDKAVDQLGYHPDLDIADGSTIISVDGVSEPNTLLNNVTHIVSSDASDTQVVTVFGHYVTADDLMVVHDQDVTLNGITPVALTQPITRSHLMQISQFATAYTAGTIQLTIGSGGQSVSTITAGQARSKKCQFSTAYDESLIIMEFSVAIVGNKNATCQGVLETRHIGGVWYDLSREFLMDVQTLGYVGPVLQVPIVVDPNHDVRLVVQTDTDNTVVSGQMHGLIAKQTDAAAAGAPK